MFTRSIIGLLLTIAMPLVAMPLVAMAVFQQDAHQHGSHGPSEAAVQPPTVFLDKSPRIVEYQLKRLDNQRLLMVPRQHDDAKYIPVYEAILARDGMSPQYQQEAAKALAKLRDSDVASELLGVLAKLDTDNRQVQRNASPLVEMLLAQPSEALGRMSAQFVEATSSPHRFHRAIGLAGLIVGGQTDTAWDVGQASAENKVAWLTSIPLLPRPELRVAARERIVPLMDDENVDVRRAAITTLAAIATKQDETFRLVAPLVMDDDLRSAAVQTLLRVPRPARDPEAAADVVDFLATLAEQTPPAQRTTDDFLDSMQLADQLLAKLPAQQARAYRDRLSEVTVRVVKLQTVEEEMRYDLGYFAVAAGRPVQIVLENHDLMPHNLVITQPGKLKEVVNLGLQAGPQGGWNGLPYVPQSEWVLAATEMVQAYQSDRITFDAPEQVGEYPYVCTFPQHWYRMYGVMVVVEDLDEWNKHPVEPANPIGSNRSFVHSWQVDDFVDELDAGMRGRTADIGAKVFAEASCQGCHKAAGNGGVIGPDLTDLFSRWKGDRIGILREILDPSHKVDAKYQMHQVLTADGRVVSGIIIKEDDQSVTILENPEAPEPTVIVRDDIDELLPSRNSMMPKALMDQYTKDEIFELMFYLQSIDPRTK